MKGSFLPDQILALCAHWPGLRLTGQSTEHSVFAEQLLSGACPHRWDWETTLQGAGAAKKLLVLPGTEGAERDLQRPPLRRQQSPLALLLLPFMAILKSPSSLVPNSLDLRPQLSSSLKARSLSRSDRVEWRIIFRRNPFALGDQEPLSLSYLLSV